ncbi:MAG: BolA family transcriptional regulator [Gammaproteobacteria bacterium]|nr:BolA family transcriptional regulator [Gammaproteobacteria bacterium]|tara:strand:- start:473 stop:805 length:333 start_codon:yes stop_codon:yes gene_type:complete
MVIQNRIEKKLSEAFQLEYFEVLNESYQHNVPENSESHFKVVLISPQFEGLRLIVRHKKVNQVLAAELRDEIHALAIHTFTPDEWKKKHGEYPESPLCLGGKVTEGHQND